MAEDMNGNNKAASLSSADSTADQEIMTVRGESLRAVYWRRFKKHTLGKIGGITLIVLYLSAILADFLAPFDMTWTNKRKSYHPPSRVYIAYDDADRTVVRPFVYEMKIANVAFKEYRIVPKRTLRVVSRETIPGRGDLRIVADAKDATSRKKAILDGTARYYGLPSRDAGILRLSKAIEELERMQSSDVHVTVRLGYRNQTGRQVPMEVILAKGNKNFLGFFIHGIPYRFLSLFQTDVHFFGSPTGGFYLIGADKFGRDMASRLLHGARVSLSVGLLGAMISFSIGLIIGGLAGFFGGAVDNLLMRISEVVYSFPAIYLLFALRATFPSALTSSQVYMLIVLILSLVGWATLARIIRGLVLSIKNEEYVLSARSLGLSNLKIIVKHILPNTLSYVIVQATITIPGYILGESALSLLGLGITEPQSSWGLMLSAARNIRVVKDFPWILVPGFLIFIAIMAWNFFGDGIRDAVDPRSRH